MPSRHSPKDRDVGAIKHQEEKKNLEVFITAKLRENRSLERWSAAERMKIQVSAHMKIENRCQFLVAKAKSLQTTTTLEIE